MRKFGICLEGIEEAFEGALKGAVKARAGEPFRYMEIGTAYAETSRAVCEILDECGAQWKVIGIDPSQDAVEHWKKRILPRWEGKAILMTMTRDVAFALGRDVIGSDLDFVFIDGCHSEKCATADFLSVEPLIRTGGLVVFHDCWEGPGGIQPHCNVELGVIPALQKLGLWSGERAGWKRRPDWTTQAHNAWPCGCFEKL